MIKKRYIKRMYIEEAYCDKCGAPLEPTGMCLSTYPAQYPYVCTNKECDGRQTFWEGNEPGRLHYEFEEEVDICTKLLP